jgi:hypothetical protein
MPQFVLERWPENDEELYWWIQAIWGFRIPRTRVCATHRAPFEAFADAFFARYPVTVWKASRGFGGKTNTLAVLTLTEAVCLAAQVSILGGSGAQSLNVHATSTEAWHAKHAPVQLLDRPPTKFDTNLTNGAYIRSLMASQTSVRGYHPQRLRLDEIDEMEMEILEAAQGQPMRKRGIETQTVMSSTHQHPEGTMTQILRRARANDWPIYEWCWRESSNPKDGWLTHDEVMRKRQEIPQHMWETEYELQEPSFENRAIDTKAVERCFDPELGVFPGDSPVKIAEPKLKTLYVTGADWAKEQDKTIVATFDTGEMPWVCVSWRKISKLPWPVMIRMAMDQWKEFGGQFTHDATGLGSVIEDTIQEEITNRHIMRMVKPVVMGGGRARQDFFSEYISAIENDDIRYPRIEHAFAEHKYVTLDDLFGKGHPPDSVVAGAMAWHSRKRHQRYRGMDIPAGGVRASSPWV